MLRIVFFAVTVELFILIEDKLGTSPQRVHTRHSCGFLIYRRQSTLGFQRTDV